jgi:hypothetical protein
MLSLASDRGLYGTRLCSFEWFRDPHQLALLLLVGLVFRVVPRTALQAISLGFVSAAETVVSKSVSKWPQRVSVDALTVFWMAVDDEHSFDASESMLRSSFAWGACLESKVHLVACDSPRCEYYDIAFVSSESPFLDLCRAKCDRISRRGFVWER